MRGSGRRRIGGLTAILVVAALLAAGCTDGDAGDSNGGAGDGAATSTGPPGDAASLSRATVDDSFDMLDQIVTEVMDETGVPGVAVAVVYDDEVLYEQGYGVRSVEDDAPVEADTVFQIASLSKPISSTIMAGLVGDDVIQWDDPVKGYAPEFELSDEWVTDHVTFADLFSHRSGLPGGPAGNDLEGIGFDRGTILPRLALVPLEGFRDSYRYSNWGMTLAGEIAASAAGSDWETVSEEVLFGPAGMDDTTMRHDALLANDNRAELHIHTGERSWAADAGRDPQAQAPAGGVSSNVGDLAEWMRIQLAAGELDGEEIIDAEALAQTHVPHITTRPPNPPDGGQPGLYGLGWNLGTEFGGLVTWSHAGAFSHGASTMAKLVPAEGLGVVVLTNGAPIGVPEAIVDAYIDHLVTGEDNTADWLATWTERMAAVYGDPLDLGPSPADPAPAAAPQAYEGTYVNEYVGEAAITAGEDGTLELAIGAPGNSYTLDHWDGDTFVYQHDRELPQDFVELARFELVDGRAVSVTLTAMDGATLGTLIRL